MRARTRPGGQVIELKAETRFKGRLDGEREMVILAK
jgi:hypothetical protein